MPSLTTLLITLLGMLAVIAWGFSFYHKNSRNGDYGKSCLGGCAFVLLIGAIVLVGNLAPR